MKLNYKRTICVGFAFFLICSFWQAYDNTIPLILTNKFGMSQTWSGLIMALDNVLALFLLPLFGAISDVQVAYVKKLVEGAGQPFTYISLPEMPHSMHGANPELYAKTVREWVAALA